MALSRAHDETPRRGPPTTALLVALLAGASGCSHDWDALDPRLSSAASSTAASSSGGGEGGGATTASTTTTSSSGGGDGGAGGAGGMGEGGMGGGGTGGGGLLDGPCPGGLAGPGLVKLTAPGGGSYCMDATEVTNIDYEVWLSTVPQTANQPAYCAANTTFVPSGAWPSATKSLPVVSVDWCDAHAYCIGIGKHLCGHIGGGPLAANKLANAGDGEWFNACSAGGMMPFPYGDVYDPAACNGADFGPSNAPVVAGAAGGCTGGSPGLLDMSGNVWEWESSCQAYVGSSDSCHVRGGAFDSAEQALGCSAAAVVIRSGGGANIGFRCCADTLAGP